MRQAALAAPLLVSGDVVGAITFLKTSSHSGFDDTDVARVTILAAQLGTALEALRLNQLSREEHRRASILVEVATALHGLPDTASVMESIADRLRVLLHSPAVLVFVQQEKIFQLQAVSTDAPKLGPAIRFAFRAERSALAAGNRDSRRGCRRANHGEHRWSLPFWRRFAAGNSRSLRPSARRGPMVPFWFIRAWHNPSQQEDKMLVSALAGFGAVAIANAELYGMARAQAHELHEILEISFELGSAGKLDEFMQTSVVRAASFLGFKRCFIGLAGGLRISHSLGVGERCGSSGRYPAL